MRVIKNMNCGYLKIAKISTFAISMLLFSGCATVPESIQYNGTSTLTVQSVQQNTPAYKGQTVRWGGIITQVINNEEDTWVELLSLELRDSGRPITNRENNQGRFIAKVSEFLDPAVYQVGRSFTAVGALTDKIDGTIGKFKYSFPVIDVKGHYLWPKSIYRRIPYIMPGYWYYGVHPMWNFGFSYYGYGVRRYNGYYPYHPFYGHLEQRVAPLTYQRSPRVYTPINNRLWEERINRFKIINGDVRRQVTEPAHNRTIAQSLRTQSKRRNVSPNPIKRSKAQPPKRGIPKIRRKVID